MFYVLGTVYFKSLDDLLPSLKDRIFSVAYITHNNLARTVYFSMMTVYFSTLTEYFQQKTVYFLVRPYILQGPYIFKERLFYHIIVCIMVPSHFIPCSLHFWSHFIPKWKNVFTTSHVHLIPGVTSYLESLHTRSHFIPWVTSYYGSLHTKSRHTRPFHTKCTSY